MAETPVDQTPPPTLPGSGQQYWCYSCDKRVALEAGADLGDVVCCECKDGFVESIAAADPDPEEDPNFGSQFIQVLRLIAQAARDEDAPPPIPSDPSNDDYLQIELAEWDDDDDEEEEDDDEHSVEVVVEEEEHRAESNRSDGEDEEEVGTEVIEQPRGEDGDEEEMRRRHRRDVLRFSLRNFATGEDEEGEEEEDEEERTEVIEPRGDDGDEEEMRRRHRRNVLRLNLRDFASRAASRRNRILDWADVLMGLENHSIELTLQVPDSDAYVGNPGDYVDASEYEALLQNLAESDNGGRRGAPPAAKAAVEGLESVEIGNEENVIACSICKDFVNVGEIAKNLPCGHGYHGECIVPWLGARNSCPVCRFELPTDDPEYEEERKKRAASSSSSSATSAAAAAGNQDSTLE